MFGSGLFGTLCRLDSLGTLLAIAASRRLEILQFDVSSAFLQGKLDERVLIQPPCGLKLAAGHCLQLDKALYGLEQTPRAWNCTFTKALNELGLVATDMDACIFSNSDKSIFLLIYVDDLFVFGNNRGHCQALVDKLGERFKIKQLQADFFLGIKIERLPTGIRLSQRQYALGMAKRFNLADANTVSSPLANAKQLMDAETIDAPYREIVGCLQYLACCTRPDVLFAANFLAKFSSRPTKIHWELLSVL